MKHELSPETAQCWGDILGEWHRDVLSVIGITHIGH